MTNAQKSELQDALHSPCCTDAERSFEDEIMDDPDKAFWFDGETLMRTEDFADEGYSLDDLAAIYY